MPVVHVMSGLPASGKSTVARKLVAGSDGTMRRVNLDDLRVMMAGPVQGRVWSSESEQMVLDVLEGAVRAAVSAGFDVVVDNTHLTPRIPKRIKAAAAGLATFVVHDLTDVPVEECIRRDAVRGEAMVGEAVIRMLAANHAKATRSGWRLTDEWMNDETPVAAYEADEGLPSAVMCDIDGTLALMHGRGPYDFAKCGQDLLNVSVRRALEAFTAQGDMIVLLSGRGEEYRPQTEAWLAEHAVPYQELWMRPAGDVRRDDIVKAELFDQHVRARFHVRVSLDDRDRVVALWRRMGLPTWQVNYGNF